MSQEETRMPVLKRLAEQAMSDAAFRRMAVNDLQGTLDHYGYDLNAKEMELVTMFRGVLANAGVDLFLKDEVDLGAIFDSASPEDLESMLGAQRNRRTR